MLGGHFVGIHDLKLGGTGLTVSRTASAFVSPSNLLPLG